MLKANYSYMVEFIEKDFAPGMKVLDYGCGKGDVVAHCRENNIDAYGAEAFSHGSGDWIKNVLEERELLGSYVRGIDIESNKVDFPDDFFDLIVTNQVFEHVVDMDKAVDELSRMLKPGGRILFIFPTLNTVLEAHCRVLFAHWLPKGRIRYSWLYLNRLFGIGRLKTTSTGRRRTVREWATFFDEWLVDNVTYRSNREIFRILQNRFRDINGVEEKYIAFRTNRVKWLRSLKWICTKFPMKYFCKWYCRRFAGVVLTAVNAIDNHDDSKEN